MVSASWAVLSNALAALVDNSIALETWTQAPYTDLLDCSSTAWVQIDLGQIRYLHRVTFWSFYDGRVHCSISVALSSSCKFAGEEITVFSCTSFSSCPTLTASGYTVSFSGQNARCVRWASGRNQRDIGVQFMELSLSAGQHSINKLHLNSERNTTRGNTVMAENGSG
jgi:hypothetical protein